MLESIFEFFFKYRPVMYARGELAFAAPGSTLLILVMAAGAAAIAFATYTKVRGRSTQRDRAVLTALRLGAVLLVMVCLLRPMLVVSSALPQRNFVGVLIDNSRSMRIADAGEETRSDVARRVFAEPDARLIQDLEEKFIVRTFSFATSAARIGAPDELTFDGSQTRVLDAVERAREDLSAVPLAGLVVVSDGADNAHGAMTEQLLSLKAQGVPIYTVGLGRPTFTKDIEISRVETPRTALKGASLVVDLMVTQRGFAGDKVPLVVEDEGKIVSQQEITLPRDGESIPVRVHVTADDPGPRQFKFRIPAQQGEIIAENNEQESLVVVSDRREKILYFEGEPRFEIKFLRRALDDDKNLQLVSMTRTAENKFYRLMVSDSLELVEGFPKTREELFKYRAIILGSVEASFFTHDQLQMMNDFVAERGGGLLFLGGRQAFGEGGYYGTPLADAMPVRFENNRIAPEEDGFFAELTVSLTPAGRVHPVTRLAPDERVSAERWTELPAVTSVNRLTGLKPGATELIAGRSARGGEHNIVLAYQNYGRGKTIAFPIQDSWMWQMHADIPVEDETHETLWRQLARWLVSSVPGSLNLIAARDRVMPNESVVLRSEVSDEQFVRVNDAEVKAFVSGPGMEEREISMEWTVDRDGEYRASFTPTMEGSFRVRSEARRDGKLLGIDTTFVLAAESRAEYFGAHMNEPLLRRIAEETGGRFYTPDKVSTLPEDMTLTKSGATVLQQLDLWDMPFLFLVLVGLIGGEWAYRKRRGLA